MVRGHLVEFEYAVEAGKGSALKREGRVPLMIRVKAPERQWLSLWTEASSDRVMGGAGGCP